MPSSLSAVRSRAKRIKLLLLDVDGTLTDGSIIYDESGQEFKVFNVLDGFGMAMMRKANLPIVLASGKHSKVVDRRAQELGVREVYQNIFDKVSLLRPLQRTYGIDVSEVAFVTDDITDLALMRKVGLAIAVADAQPDVKRRAHFITQHRGGRGAVREVCELILKSQGMWQRLVRSFYET